MVNLRGKKRKNNHEKKDRKNSGGGLAILKKSYRFQIMYLLFQVKDKFMGAGSLLSSKTFKKVLVKRPICLGLNKASRGRDLADQVEELDWRREIEGKESSLS